MDALISSGLNLGDLGTVFKQLPQALDTLQKFLPSDANKNENENESEDNSNNEGNQGNQLLEALISSGLNLGDLGTVFGKMPQILDTLQTLLASGANKNENEDNGNSEGNQENPLMNALGLDGLNLDELGTILQRLPQIIDTFKNLFSSGGIENFGAILAALQEKVQEIPSSQLADEPTCSQPDPIDMFKDPSEASENGVELEIPSEGARDEL